MDFEKQVDFVTARYGVRGNQPWLWHKRNCRRWGPRKSTPLRPVLDTRADQLR